MQEIKNKIFYHIQNLDQPGLKKEWSKGDRVAIGDKLNPYSYILENVLANHPDRSTWLEINLGHFYKCTREAVIEDVRHREYPDYPSRRNCLWLIESKEESIEYWWNHFKQTSREPQKLSLLKLEVSGKIFKTSQQHLLSNLSTVSEIRKHAFKYWQGENAEEESEILFEGTVEVLEKIK